MTRVKFSERFGIAVTGVQPVESQSATWSMKRSAAK
eukprot:gene23648-9851_t